MSAIQDAAPVSAGWLHNSRFDLGFILGLAGVAVGAAALLAGAPRFYVAVLTIDLWVLGYQHVISTFTRLCFDRESFARHRFLVVQLPLLVLGATAAVTLGLGGWVVATVYFYWQWFHTARQSWGIAQMYRRKSGGLVAEEPRLLALAFSLLPLWGILHRSAQHPALFLGLPVHTLPVPGIVVDLVGAAALVAIAWWAAQRAVAAMRGQLPLAHTLYMVSHFTLFAIGYLVMADIDAGWVVVNIWHTSQYMIIVWLYNNNRFRGGLDARAPLLSALSQPGDAGRYVLLCLALSTGAYGVLYLAAGLFPATGVLIVLIASQTINFHHFLVDGVIWRGGRRAAAKPAALAH